MSKTLVVPAFPTAGGSTADSDGSGFEACGALGVRFGATAIGHTVAMKAVSVSLTGSQRGSLLGDDPTRNQPTQLAPGQPKATCRAPATSMYFNQHGDVRACCFNVGGVLGDIRTSTVREIWDGAPTARLRAALARDDYSLGCDFCDWQQQNGDTATVFSRRFDGLTVTASEPSWPVQMEFALSNACNLQCVMCTGWNSSAIRFHREGLPPLPSVYGDRFFAELEEFLPHLKQVNLLGGEPFLCRETLRLLDMIVALEDPPAVSVTTNATQWSPRVKRLLDAVPMTFTVSVDAVSRDVYEGIRIGASRDVVLENVRRYQRYARRNGTDIGFTVCLMPESIGDFVNLLCYAEDQGLDFVNVNVVTLPAGHSLYALPHDQLASLAQALAAAGAAAGVRLGRFRDVFEEQMGVLRRLLEGDRVGTRVPLTQPWAGADSAETSRCAAWLSEWSGAAITVIRADGSFEIVEIDGQLLDLLGPTKERWVGRPLPAVMEHISSATGASLQPTAAESGLSNEVALAGDGPSAHIEVRSFLFADGADLVALVAMRRESHEQ